ncbi:hypothetical protein HY488_01100 [Candidatus Woesearchaeota archaeon]|nr:hypothetical protein [Candidatus Woesearchaeota archaeon]
MTTMQKRGLRNRVASFALAALLTLPFVAAQGSPLSSIGNLIQRTLGPILLSWGGAGFAFWGKALLWVLIFAIFFAIMSMVPPLREWSRNIRVTVSAVLAFISVLPLGVPLMRALFETYGVVVATLLIFLPIAGLIFLTHRIPTGRSRLVYGIRAIMFYILAAVIQNVVAGIQMQAFATSPALGEAGNFAVGVCGLLFLYNVIMMLFGGPEETPHRQVAEGAGNFWDWLRDTVTPEGPAPPPGTPYPDHLVAHIGQLCNTINQFHTLIMLRGAPGAAAMSYRQVGNLLLDAEQRAFRHGHAAMWAALPTRRQNFQDAAAAARGLRMAIQDGIDRLINDPQFANLRRAHQRRWQRCMRQWTVVFLHYQQYNIRFMINYAAVAGPVHI